MNSELLSRVLFLSLKIVILTNNTKTRLKSRPCFQFLKNTYRKKFYRRRALE